VEAIANALFFSWSLYGVAIKPESTGFCINFAINGDATAVVFGYRGYKCAFRVSWEAIKSAVSTQGKRSLNRDCINCIIVTQAG